MNRKLYAAAGETPTHALRAAAAAAVAAGDEAAVLPATEADALRAQG